MSSENPLKKAKNIHFIGIGGIGISAIARMMLEEGRRVSGSDSAASKVTEELQKHGAHISIGQRKENVPAGCDLVIHTVAIAETNPELAEARGRNLPILTYPQTLNLISREKYTIAIAGTHGKTTTTAMTAKVLIDSGLDPTVIVGSLLKGEGKGGDSNFISGKSQYLVVEADEYRKSFHNLEPKILVITNIDLDHLDYYQDLADIQNAFGELVEKIPKDGFLICDQSQPQVAVVAARAKCAVLDYGIAANFAAPLQVPGEHNRQNAKAALAVGKALGISEAAAQKSLASFAGTWRRFDFKGTMANGTIVYDDYAHNPQKVRAALQGAREFFGSKRIIAVFQPHLYSRTKDFLAEFGKSFGDADLALLAPIYAAREAHDPSIASAMLEQEILKNGVKAVAFESLPALEKHLRGILRGDEAVITIGAGDIYQVGENLLK